MGSYIKIDRKIIDWEWYGDINTCRLFFHMLLKANWRDAKFQGEDVPRGSFISSVRKLSEETGLTEREVRTAISHLKTTHEVTGKSHTKYTVFTIKNYCLYQSGDTQNDRQTTDERQTNDMLTTNKRQTNDKRTTTIEEIKNLKKEEEKEGKKKDKKSSTGEDMGQLFLRLAPGYPLSDPVTEKIHDWLKYKAERKDTYREQGMKSLLTTISKYVSQYGDGNVTNLIDECMASGWAGIIWDRLENKNQKTSPYMGAIKNRVSEVDNWI